MSEIATALGYGLLPAILWFGLATCLIRHRSRLALSRNWLWFGIALDGLLIGSVTTALDGYVSGALRSGLFLVVTPIAMTALTLMALATFHPFVPLPSLSANKSTMTRGFGREKVRAAGRKK